MSRILRSALDSGIPVLLAILLASSALQTTAAEIEEPCTGQSDWIRLTSSEWLKGDLRRMRSLSLDFKSKEMKALRLEWKKVAEVCLGTQARFVTAGYTVYLGKGVVRDDHVIVDTPEGKVRFPRTELLAILPGAGREIEKWGFKLGAGVDANVGNTEQTALNLNVALRREDRWTRGEVSYFGSYGTADRQENLNRHRIDANLSWFFSRHLYWVVIDLPFLYDKFQNLDVRVTPNSGLGWQLFELAVFELSLEAGLGYQYTEFISVVPPQDPTASDAAVRLAMNFKWDVLNDLQLKLDHDTLLVPTDMGQTSLYTRAILKYELTDLLKLETTFAHSRIWKPVRRADGTRPDSDDFQLIVGLSFEIY
jgi:putative salt-induced outer membrane protein YdiY